MRRILQVLELLTIISALSVDKALAYSQHQPNSELRNQHQYLHTQNIAIVKIQQCWRNIRSGNPNFSFIFLLVRLRLGCKPKISFHGCLEVPQKFVWVVGGGGWVGG